MMQGGCCKFWREIREMLLTIQGREPLEEAGDEESLEGDSLPIPELNNLSSIGEEFSTTVSYYPRKRMRLTQQCLKNDVNF